MTSRLIWQMRSVSAADTERVGGLLGRLLGGGEAIELAADLGGGKTTFVRGLARGAGCNEAVTSPTFTLSRVYKCRGGLEIHHFDFYRLNEPGVVADQLAESLNDPQVVTVVEWSDIVKDVLPKNHLSVTFTPMAGDSQRRELTFSYPMSLQPLIEKLRTKWEEVEP